MVGLTQWIPGTLYPHKKLLEAPTPLHLDSNVVTIAQLLKSAGYQTAAIGKWHLGGEGYLPESFGFDVNIGGDRHGSPPSYFGPFPFHNLIGFTKDDYLTGVLTEKMEAHIREVASMHVSQPTWQAFVLCANRIRVSDIWYDGYH